MTGHRFSWPFGQNNWHRLAAFLAENPADHVPPAPSDLEEPPLTPEEEEYFSSLPPQQGALF